MSRMRWGGGGDYSSLFAALYQQQENKAKQDEADLKAEQSAEDADMFDQWQQGLISDDQILAYIDRRVAETAGDPKQHQKWVEAQRSYRESIADNQALTAYQSGGSINDYIAYLQGKLGRMVSNSNEYRTIQQKLTQLMDQRASEDVQWRAKVISDGISSGKYTYKDLLKVYQDALKTARPGSDLRTQLETAISDVKAQLTQGEVQGELAKIQYQYDSGSISGKEAGRRLRGVAEKYYKGDPAQYYKMLSAAVDFEKAKAKGSGTGGSTKAINASIDVLQSQERRFNDIISQWNDGASTAIDMATGDEIPDTPAYRAAVAKAALDNFDKLAATYTTKGDHSAASGALARKTTFIRQKIQPYNTLDDAEQLRQMLVAAGGRLNAAEKNPDPQAMLNVGVEIAMDLREFARGLTQKGGYSPDRPIAAQAGPTALPMTQQPVEKFVQEVLAAAGAIEAAAQAGNAQAVNSMLETVFAKQTTGTYLPDTLLTQIGTKLGQASELVQGLKDGSRAYAVDGQGGIYVVPSVPVTVSQMDPTTGATTLGTATRPNIDPGKDGKLVRVVINVNGVPTSAWAVARPAAPYNVYTAAKTIETDDQKLIPGAAIPDSIVAWAKKTEVKGTGQTYWEQWVAEGSIEKAPADMGLYLVEMPGYTDSDGATYKPTQYWLDSKTGYYYKGDTPIQWANLNADGTVKVGDDGRPSMNWQPYGTAGGTPMIYVGNDPKAMQQLFDSGAFGKVDLLHRGWNGEVDPESLHSDDPFAFYDPYPAASRVGGALDWQKWTKPKDDADWLDPFMKMAKIAQAKETALLSGQTGFTVGQQSADNPVAGLVGMVANLVSLGKNIQTQATAPIPAAPTYTPPTAPTAPFVPSPTVPGALTIPKISSGPTTVPSVKGRVYDEGRPQEDPITVIKPIDLPKQTQSAAALHKNVAL